ncbi:unnamed protein product [Prorocentrum cordatum]|uniref:Solute carrier family 40 protein n=1 Tax=Prorocentrum cordatum TaxID=2364126 RepID=A0ABN9XZZ0_9DINO|nr:unnamed protein product [Polarella glacialis]
MSLLGSALGVGCTVGPFLGSQAAERLGEDAPVVIAVAMFALLGAVVFGALPETMPKPARAYGGGGGAAAAEGSPLWRDREVVAALAVLGLPELGLICHTSVAVNTFAVHHLQLSKAWLAGLSSAVSAMQAAVAGGLCTFLAGRGCSDVAMMQLGIASFAATSASIWAWQSPQAIALSAPAAALGNGFLRSIPAAFLSKRVPRDRQGQAMGLMDMCSAALRVAAPVLAGSLMDRFGGGSVFLGQAVLFTLSGVCLSFLAPGRGGGAAGRHEKRS